MYITPIFEVKICVIKQVVYLLLHYTYIKIVIIMRCVSNHKNEIDRIQCESYTL